MTWWRGQEVSDWPIRDWEPRGRRSKAWIAAPDSSLWLRKSPRDSRPSEPAIELFALELARRVGIPATEATAAEWAHPEGRARGIVAHRFLDAELEILWTGDALLRSTDDDYDPDRYELHTVASLQRIVAGIGEAFGVSLEREMLEVLLFDAWIGNGDRHQQNWGVIFVAPQGDHQNLSARLAPMFDPACCLGAELQPNDIRLRDPSSERLARYVRGCPSGFGDGKSLIPMTRVVDDLALWPGFIAATGDVIARFQRGLNTHVEELLAAIPEDWLEAPRKRFACLILERRLRWLEKAALELIGSG